MRLARRRRLVYPYEIVRMLTGGTDGGLGATPLPAGRFEEYDLEAGVTPPVSVDFMVPKGTETEVPTQVVQSMAAEAGFDMKIRVTEFATSLKQAEAGEYQAYLLAWSGRIDPDGNCYIFLHTGGPTELQRLEQSRRRQGAGGCAAHDRQCETQGDLRATG